jgi:hypothetical protein
VLFSPPSSFSPHFLSPFISFLCESWINQREREKDRVKERERDRKRKREQRRKMETEKERNKKKNNLKKREETFQSPISA